MMRFFTTGGMEAKNEFPRIFIDFVLYVPILRRKDTKKYASRRANLFQITVKINKEIECFFLRKQNILKKK